MRADFDSAGLAHMRALLGACPSATPWRMGADDYRSSAAPAPAGTPPLSVGLADSRWDQALARAMNELGAPAFEDALLPALLKDLARAAPS